MFTPLSAVEVSAIGILILVGAGLYNQRPDRAREVRWENLVLAVITLLVAVLAITTERVGKMWFPEMSTSGWPARVIGILCLIMSVMSFSASFRQRDPGDRDQGPG